MADGTVQRSRLVKLTSPLGRDVLLFHKMSGTEGISQLFEWTIEALAQDDYIEEDQIVGRGCTVEIECLDGIVRYFHGLCTEISIIGATGRRICYAITLRPHLWLLSLQSDSRIFSNMKVGDIIAEVLDTAGLTDFEIALTADYEPIPYCVQYQESNFDFVCRLMEKYGIVYFFKHGNDRHILVLADSIGQFEPVQGAETLTYNTDSGLLFGENYLSRVRLSEQIVTDTIDADEYNYETVGNKLKVNKADLGSHGMTGNALYDFRTSYLKSSVGEQLTKVSLEAERAKTKRIVAEGVAPAIYSGCRLNIASCPLPGTEEELTCLAVHHEIRSDSYGTVMVGEADGMDEESAQDLYKGQYTLTPWSVPYRAPKLAPWPRIAGHHTATVVGADGEEIDVDNQGRILVHFHWERAKKPSCRLRIAQPLAGSGFGIMNTPRIGHEVLVSFVDGDPDRPLVVGSVYNSKNQPPLGMPASKTQMGMRSNSSKGGGGASEIILDDAKDSEKIAVVAERDYTTKVKNDATISVGYDHASPGSYKLDVNQDRTESVTLGDYTLSVDTGNRKTTIKTNDELEVTGESKATITGNDTRTAKADSTHDITGSHNGSVGKHRKQSVALTDMLNVGISLTQTIGSALVTTAKTIVMTGASSVGINSSAVSISGSKTVSIGDETISIKGKKITIDGSEITINAKSKIQLKVGGSKITMSKSSVATKARSIKEN